MGLLAIDNLNRKLLETYAIAFIFLLAEDPRVSRRDECQTGFTLVISIFYN